MSDIWNLNLMISRRSFMGVIMILSTNRVLNNVRCSRHPHRGDVLFIVLSFSFVFLVLFWLWTSPLIVDLRRVLALSCFLCYLFDTANFSCWTIYAQITNSMLWRNQPYNTYPGFPGRIFKITCLSFAQLEVRSKHISESQKWLVPLHIPHPTFWGNPWCLNGIFSGLWWHRGYTSLSNKTLNRGVVYRWLDEECMCTHISLSPLFDGHNVMLITGLD